jgi:hypothetical protein
MKDNYCESCTCIIAWDDTVQDSEAKKVHSKHGLFTTDQLEKLGN